ncbi:LysM domain-containing protein [Arthrobacter sp. SLBN-100]|uniref:LysM peptidoglycan-binding domain-containing protein n=1 Tax=Arthrobacter sp. SLBN-100 TaxID=2768450 RepID=UPI0011703423|nr:LysM peptidoglycan-binding domain-containing protein [Arthrobacter sp. SLBN-100]TQJ66585.1 LysM domain-containing protein [Arthrobacter sp. SLBN-100]
MSNPARRLSVAVTAGAMSAAVLSSLIGGSAAYAVAPATYHAPMEVSSSGTYTVRSGDTLSGIAARHGVSLAAVFSANNMNMGTIIYPGQKIQVGPDTTTPAAKPAAVPTPAAPASSHTVRSGDTLSAIASKYGVSLSSVLAANNLQLRSIIYPGQTIKLATSAAPVVSQPAPAPAQSPSAPSAAATYTVKSGDTLSAIAARQGVSLDNILAANNLQMRSVIYPRQAIKLAAPPAPPAQPAPPAPAPIAPAVTSITPATAATYDVKAGDTMSRIASAHGVSLSSVLSANGVTLNTVIYRGQSIKLGTGTPSAPAQAPAPAAAPAASPSSAELKTMLADTARHMGVDPSLALAFAMQESGFRQNVTSSAGAIGPCRSCPHQGSGHPSLSAGSLTCATPRTTSPPASPLSRPW